MSLKWSLFCHLDFYGKQKIYFDKHQPFIMNYLITKYKLMISNHLPLTRKPLIKCHQNGHRSATLTFSIGNHFSNYLCQTSNFSAISQQEQFCFDMMMTACIKLSCLAEFLYCYLTNSHVSPLRHINPHTEPSSRYS